MKVQMAEQYKWLYILLPAQEACDLTGNQTKKK
jgi:hypothetical protein